MDIKAEQPTEYAEKLAETVLEFAGTHHADQEICAVLVCRNMNLPAAAITMIQAANGGHAVLVLGDTINVIPD